MARVAFADESGTNASPKCYAIGVLSLAEEHLARFNASFERLKAQHGVGHEVHWTEVNRGHGLINLGLDWLSKLLRSRTARFDAIVVNTALYRQWREPQACHETAFYKTYTLLLQYIAGQVGERTQVRIDDRSDSYGKQTEVIETIGNRMLAQLQSQGRLDGVTKVRSHDTPGVQLADFFTGAIAASHRLLLDPNTQLNAGKRLAIARMGQMLGWDALHYDTLPHSRFNIWHFPVEYRANPATRRVLREPPTFVTANDLQAANAKSLLAV